MTWSKLDDSFYDDPDILAAGNEAAGVFCRALSYCGKQLTDGYIRADMAVFIAKGRRRVIRALVDSGLWEEAEGGYRVVNYLDFNPSRIEVLERRRKDSERKAARNPSGSRKEPGSGRVRA